MKESAAQSVKRAETRIQQLCCLGLGDQLLIPVILEALHDIIPSQNNVFFWSDTGGRVVNLYNESPEAMELATFYYHEFYNSRELEVFRGWQSFILGSNRAMDFDELLCVERRRLLNHSFYNEFLAKIDFHWGLQMVIREGNRRYGSLGLCRSRHDQPFTRKDAQLLNRLNMFLAHAMVKPPQPEHDWVDGDDAGYLVADRNGRIQWSSQRGRQFLYLAMHESFTPARQQYQSASLPEPLRRICHALDAVSNDKPGKQPPVWQHENAWGRFRFRAHWLEPGADQNPLIGITAHRQEPLPLKFMRRIQDLPLSRKQGQVCLLMASGKTYRQIADQMHITENTAVSHSRAIYEKLKARNRSELISKLLNS